MTAHPDDEAMFFAPAILSLRKSDVVLSALCLSIGNADGLGMIRKKELYDSYQQMGLSAAQVKVIDHP